MCIEIDFSDIISVLAIPTETLTWNAPAARFAPVVGSDSYNLPATGTIYVGRSTYQPLGSAHTPQYSLPMASQSGSVKDESSLAVGGRIHQVAVSFDVDAKTAADFENLQRLERGDWCLELCFFGDTGGAPARAIVQATKDTCSVAVVLDDNKASVKITIENLMGVQPIF